MRISLYNIFHSQQRAVCVKVTRKSKQKGRFAKHLFHALELFCNLVLFFFLVPWVALLQMDVFCIDKNFPYRRISILFLFSEFLLNLQYFKVIGSKQSLCI